MIKIYSKILFPVFLIALLMSSCGKEEFYLEDDFPSIGTDTIVVDDRVFLSTTAGQVMLKGLYSECDLSNTLAEAPTKTHLLVYAENLEIDNNIPFYDGPLYLLYWTSSRILETGSYLVEGITLGETTEENSLFNLTITEVAEYNIKGYFSTQDGNANPVEGEFSTQRYTCEELDADGEEFAEYADGRMTLGVDSGNEKLLMSVASYCEDIFIDRPGPSRIIFGGGAFYLDEEDEVTFDEDPELLIVFDLDVLATIEINESFRAYYLDNIADLLNITGDPSYTEVIALGSPISVTITSETTNYLEGTYEGILLDGRKVIGTFRANITRGC